MIGKVSVKKYLSIAVNKWNSKICTHPGFASCAGLGPFRQKINQTIHIKPHCLMYIVMSIFDKIPPNYIFLYCPIQPKVSVISYMHFCDKLRAQVMKGKAGKRAYRPVENYIHGNHISFQYFYKNNRLEFGLLPKNFSKGFLFDFQIVPKV